MANDIGTRLGGAWEGFSPVEIFQVTAVDGNDFSFVVGFMPSKVVIYTNSGTTDVKVEQFLAAGYAPAFRQNSASAHGGQFGTAAVATVAAGSAGYTVTVDASEALILASSTCIIEVWR